MIKEISPLTGILIGIGGTLLGIFISSVFNYFIFRDNRKDKYLFTLVKFRFKIYQEAYSRANKLKYLMHNNDENKINIVNETREWFNNHNLYLRPDIRDDFNDFITDVDDYWMHRKITKESTGGDRKIKNKELEDLFKKITSITKRIEKSINIYYSY
ncbi:MAG: hypothetical protein ABR980_11640 [Ignavibacteriaceae bacterium]|jgi:hypothetical protein